MKTDKSPTDEETPSKKVLKQTRLPFKIIRTDVSPSPSPPQTRKRKLSENNLETPSKIGKVCKENDLIDDLIVLSDDNSQDGPILQKDEQTVNPLVTIVDKARKKKLQKSKSKKKTSKVKKNDSLCSDTLTDTNDENETDAVEMMDVDIPSNLTHSKNSDETKSPNNIPEPTVTPTESLKSNQNLNDIIILEDSNNSSDDKSKKSDTVIKNLTEADTSNNDNEKELENKSTDVITDNTKNDTDITQTVNQETPRRSIRNKTKIEENELNSSTSSSKLDESICSDSTPKHNIKVSVTSDETAHDSTGSNNLTPKQLQKKLESAKKKEEREKEKQEREKKRQQEKEERAKQKQEKEDQKKREREEKEEAKKREKEEKEEQKKKEREEKERQKELEKKLKEEKEEQKRIEREEKEEQRKKEKEAKEEEKRKKQEALEQERLEQELKKKKAAEAFLNFFVPKQKTDKDQNTVGLVSNSMLSSFTIKLDMRLAPIIRNDLSKDKQQYLDNVLKEQNVSENDLYLKSLKSGAVKPGSSGKTWPLSDKDDDVMIIEDELPPIDGAGEIFTCESAAREKLRPKLLSFHENRRPPYWGTWRKKSASIKPRRPFGQDEKQLDYEVDSDEEWEEEEGESIDGSAAGSDDEQSPDEYEVDNEVFVPHGYLSDEEATMDEDDVMSLSPETQKAKLKHLEDEFESEMKKPTEKLKPRLYGLLWETSEGGKPENCVDALWNYFAKFSMIMNDPRPLLQPSNVPEETEKKKIKKKKTVKESNEEEQQSPKNKKKKANLETKESKKPKTEIKKPAPEIKNQPAINSFLSKLKPT